MQNRIETLRAEIAQRQSELKNLENDQQAERDEIMDIIKSVTRRKDNLFLKIKNCSRKCWMT